LLEEKLDIFVKNYAIKIRVLISLFLEKESPTALDDEREELGLKDSLVSYEVRKSELVNKEHITDEKEVDIGPVGRQQDNWKFAVLFDLSDLLQHLHVDGDLLIEALEGLMQGIGHSPHYRHLDLCD
jgi:hypothetical protein